MIEFQPVISQENTSEVSRLARIIWQEHYLAIIGQEQVDYMLEKFQSKTVITQQLDQGYEYYLILYQGQSTGYAAVAPIPDSIPPKLLLSKIYIEKHLRGRGLGKKTLKFAEELCRKRGFTTIRLTVNKNNSHSIEWYKRMGFTNIESIVQDIGCGFVMDDFIMEKTVSQA